MIIGCENNVFIVFYFLDNVKKKCYICVMVYFGFVNNVIILFFMVLSIYCYWYYYYI